ncbi:ATP-dependent zinc metalloprotease FtsH [Francisella tularensis]|uniref:ATP-dependent zinc metalloprotease FtsH n=16 Tax=Gammaproteobacteria TaxID=1236 RepID=A0ABF7PTK9_FRATH|nr:ATP-dependent zinc metalloprotease FtsH [Francisella tularensis]AFX71096.1 ATP-dependent metallopeptidase family protein [Francisella tularensis subsp. holarctica F92]EBA52954.1 ATP-dependent metalloprotease [Francisella tularensis subsp. holarctica 257]ABU62027.1 ATP-dependent metallopeptidase family protein [Francisella tularensis subsp. holarctica FTNF002-00]AFT93129.1 ATP-dependent metalloprotease [Francisella tularensis subsp. holarctica FSC200]AKO68336.1 ATP-dependent metalloprotease 
MAQNNDNKNNMIKNIIFWILIIGGMLLLFNGINDTNGSSKNINYSTFISKLKDNQISVIDVDGRTITGKTNEGESFVTYAPLLDGSLVNKLEDSNAIVKAKAPEKPNIFLAFLLNWLPMLLIFGFFIYMMVKAGGGSKGGPFSVGKSKAKLLGEDEIKVTLDDVAGVDEAKEEVAEIVDFLREPKKYEKIGGKIPKGVLMVGPPGTGKTLLARAIAGEAKVPFFSISGSDFVEMFVGVGASRVRDMFEQAKKKAPCLVFIDEIDAVGRHRGSGMGGGNDEREQTLNQMLVEMDGFADNEGVIVIAATNRPDVLDRALLRPGRFDRQVTVGLPTVKGREAILKVHMKKVALGEDVRADWIARGTPGFSGAELANLVNEAALFAARESKDKVSMADFEKAKDKILMGSERRSMAMTEKEKRLTAYHEAGHAIIGRLMPEHDPVYKVSIIPRGRALGVTMYMPEGDTVSQSRLVLRGRLCSIFGGRIAEELIFGYDHVTTGASNDIQVATDIARNYVARWGLSDAMGTILYDVEDEGPFGGSGGKSVKLSDSTIREVDTEVRKLIATSYAKAKQLLEKNIDILHAMADALMKYETIDALQVDDLMARRPVREPGEYGDSYKPKDTGKVIAPVVPNEDELEIADDSSLKEDL